MVDILFDGPDNARASFLFAHGAGVGMDSEFMTSIAEGLAANDIRVARFEFAYMAQRRTGGSKRPPPKVDKLEIEYKEAIELLAPESALFIGGKSMGGRVASLIADDLYTAGNLAGLICLGYPFHPPGKPESLRTAHLEALHTPTLICQGTRDPFGTLDDVKTYKLSKKIVFEWLEDGEHSFKPRKSADVTLEENLAQAVEAITYFINQHA